MPRNAHGPMCADAARGGPACAHAAIGNGAYGTPDHTWRMNNGQAQAWWEAPDGSRYLLACVRDDDASGAHGVAVWMLFPVENVWRRVAVVPSEGTPLYPAMAVRGTRITIAWIVMDPSGASYHFWVVRGRRPEQLRAEAPQELLEQPARSVGVGASKEYGSCKYLSTDGEVFVWTETAPQPTGEEIDVAAMRFDEGGAGPYQLAYFTGAGPVTLTHRSGVATLTATEVTSDPSVASSVDGRWRVVAWEEKGDDGVEGPGGTFLIAQVEDLTTGEVYGPAYVRDPEGYAALGGDVSVSITSNGVYLGHQGLGTGESDGGVWLMSHALPGVDVTMEDPWTPAVGGTEPFPERGMGGVDHGWLMNVDARATESASDQVSAAWEWSQAALTFLPDHEARLAAFSKVEGTLRRVLAKELATAEVVSEPDVYQVSATARFEPKSPGVPAGWPDGVGLDNDVGSDSGFPGPWDDLLLLGRVDVFYFEVEVVDFDTYLVKFIHEAFTLGGARFPPALVVVPHV